MTNDDKRKKNEQRKHLKINQVYAHNLLLRDHETGSELLPYGKMTQNEDGGNVLYVCDPQGRRFLKHTIYTEETTQIEAHKISS